jgi:CubicO group peptidase (beta-lactamase class C family)
MVVAWPAPRLHGTRAASSDRQVRGGRGMRSAFVGVVAVAALWLTAGCGTACADDVDDYLTATMARERIPGASVLIVRKGTIAKERGYGVANVELGVAASADTVYQSGSTGKQFTAAGILLLAEDGKLALDDHLTKFFPDAPAAWHRITIRHLLTHTSGIRDYEGGTDVDYRRDYDEEALLRVMMRLPVDFEPGSQWTYSNSGYLILGLLTSKLSGMHWSDFQARRLFKPLGMSTTRVISESDIVANRAAGYVLDEHGSLKNQEWVAPSLNRCADGALYYTIKDLAAWDAALRAGVFLRPASQAAWMRPVALADGSEYQYGFGWFVAEQRGRRLIEHGGAWQGFRTAIARYADPELTVVVLTNLGSADPETLAHEIAGIVEPDYRLPAMDASRLDPVPGRGARLQKVLEAWSDGRTDPRMAKGLAHTASGSSREAHARAQTGERLRDLRSFRFLDEDRLAAAPLRWRGEPVTTIAYYALQTANQRFGYRFYLTNDGHVADFEAERR